MDQATMAKTDRVVISVVGGVAEEVVQLACGPAVVYIVDFDEINELREKEMLAEQERYIRQFPEDVQLWIHKEME